MINFRVKTETQNENAQKYSNHNRKKQARISNFIPGQSVWNTCTNINYQILLRVLRQNYQVSVRVIGILLRYP